MISLLKKIGVLIGGFSILYPIFTSVLDDGKFRSALGSCPVREGQDRVNLGRLEGRWYTHWVCEKFLPWSKVQCLSHRIDSDSNKELRLRSLFNILNIPFDFELKATINPEIENGQLDIIFFNSTFGNLLQHKFTVIRSDPSGAALLWTCIDFKFLHFELATVMTKYTELKDRRINDEFFKKMEVNVKQLGFPIKYVSEIDHARCS